MALINPKCTPLSINVDAPSGPPLPGLPGFGLDINFPTPKLDGLENFPENILEWLNRLRFRMPGGSYLKDQIEKLSKSIAGIINNLLTWLNVFMGFYYFIMAIIELILCMIKVLCAMPKPWSIARAVKRLLRKCIPLFITICFPFFALLLILLALIGILLALLEYIFAMIKRLIEQLIKNFKKLKAMIQTQRNANAALAIVAKIANLLCLFEQIFQFLGVVFAILDLITGQWSKILSVCSSKDSGGPDDDSVCAAFMKDPLIQTKDSPEIWVSKVGNKILSDNTIVPDNQHGYVKYVNSVFGEVAPAMPVVNLRSECVYMIDDQLTADLKFNNIIEYGGFNFFPFDKTITNDLKERFKPYLVDLTINYDDGYNQARDIKINDVTVILANTQAIVDVVNSKQIFQEDNSGFLYLLGGTVVDDQYRNGAKIEDVLSKRGTASEIKVSQTNGIQTDWIHIIQYKLKINFDALLEYMLITFNCLPTAKIEQSVLETSFSKAFNTPLSDLVTLPDVGGALDKMQACMATLRNSINEDSINTFGTCMTNAANDLYNQASNTYCQLLMAAMDVYNMNKSIDTDLQFINKNIKITVTPKDQTGNTLVELIGGFTPPQGCLDNIASKFMAKPTLGKATSFSYDGYGNFVSNLISQDAGDGYLSLYYDGNLIVTVIRPTDIAVQPSINDNPIPYSFIGATIVDGYQGEIRRDETDTANNG